MLDLVTEFTKFHSIKNLLFYFKLMNYIKGFFIFWVTGNYLVSLYAVEIMYTVMDNYKRS